MKIEPPRIVGKFDFSKLEPNLNPNVSKIDLSNKNLEIVPSEILCLKNLKKLNLSNNNLKSLPKDFYKLKRLENLNLSNNKLTSVYSNICKLTNLKVLILNNNQLKNLPSQIVKLQKLRILSVSGNNLKSLPLYFPLLKNLESLNISSNKFEELPDIIFSLKKLKRLWLNNNNFVTIQLKDFVTDLPNLKSFYCFHAGDPDFHIVHTKFGDFIGKRGNILSSLKTEINEQNLNTFDMINSFPSEKDLITHINIISDTNEQIQQMNKKNKIFISYCREDEKYLKMLKRHLKSMQFEGLNIDYWDDKRIRSGDKWKEEIEKALSESNIAILLISPDFLSSDFIQNNELPDILKNADEKGTKVLSIILKPCRYIHNKSISQFLAVNDPKKSLIKVAEFEQEEILVKVTEDIESHLNK